MLLFTRINNQVNYFIQIMERQTVIEKLSYAQNRLNKILDLSRLEVFFNDFQTRQRVTHEFFFHLIGAMDYLLQFINDQLDLGLQTKKVDAGNVKKRLANQNPEHKLAPLIELFSIDLRNRSILNEPYSNTGMMFRIKNYRNRVAHRGLNPYNIVVANDINAYMFIDPEFPGLGNSDLSFLTDLRAMFELVSTNIHLALDILDR